VVPTGPVMWASYRDTRGDARQMAMAMMSMPMAIFMAGQMSPELAEALNNPKVQTALNMIGKLAPVVAQMDFEESMSTVCSFKQDHWHSESVTTFAAPASADTTDRRDQVERDLDGL